MTTSATATGKPEDNTMGETAPAAGARRYFLPFAFALTVLGADASLPSLPGVPDWRVDARGAWFYSLWQNRPEGFEWFRRYWAYGSVEGLIQAHFDDSLWRRGDIKTYVQRLPQGRHVAEVESLLEKMEELDWSNVQTAADLQRFVESYPRGRRAAEAQSRLQETFRSGLVAQIRRNDIRGARALLRPGVDLNFLSADGVTPLIIATALGREELVADLIANGADVNLTASDGRTPLMAATASIIPISILQRLIESGANTDAKDRLGNTALISAARNGSAQKVRFLVERGADVNATTQDGTTALMAVVQARLIGNVQALLQAGADATAKNRNGDTALTLAISSQQVEIAQFLRAASPPRRATAPGTPASSPSARPPEGAAQAAPPSPSPQNPRAPEAAIEAGISAFARKDYTAAETAAREALATRDPLLAVKANYLLAQALFGRSAWRQAAGAYDSTYKRAPSGEYAFDALLGFAEASGRAGRNTPACQALSQIESGLPNLRPEQRARVQATRSRFKC